MRNDPTYARTDNGRFERCHFLGNLSDRFRLAMMHPEDNRRSILYGEDLERVPIRFASQLTSYMGG